MPSLKHKTITVLLCLSLGFFPTLLPTLANDCPVIVQEALDQANSNCANIGRNQVCYGNENIQIKSHPGCGDFNFSHPGDLASVQAIETLTLSGLDINTHQWGIALMRVQANLPNSLPGENVTFVIFGNVMIQNAVAPLTSGTQATIHTTEGDQLNMRNAPSINGSIISQLPNGSQVTVQDGPTIADGYTWWRVLTANRNEGWVIESCDDHNMRLPTLLPPGNNNLYAPMQAFYFGSGVGDSQCYEAPESGLLIQTPHGRGTINLRANEVSIELASTVYLQAQPGGEMTVNVLEGEARVTAFGMTQIVPAGQRTRLPMTVNLQPAGAPSASESYNSAQFHSLPTQLLERPTQLTTERQVTLGTGDIQITLTWDNGADLDLIVTEPNKEVIYYDNRHSKTGGQLDIDSNYPCGQNPGSVENVFWPTGQAPTGNYTIMIDEASSCGYAPPNWTLTVYDDGRVVLTRTGTGGGYEYTISRDEK